jgi:hypothetical protein
MMTILSDRLPSWKSLVFAVVCLNASFIACAQNITAFSGGGQRAQVGTAFSNPFVAVVTNTSGVPQSGQSVTFSGSGLDTNYTYTATTDANGRASLALYANATAGAYTVTAILNGAHSAMATFGARQGTNASCTANISVTSGNDAGAGTLREAVNEVCAGGTIDLTPLTCGSTVTLASRLYLASDVTIKGPPSCGTPVTISGNNVTRQFFVQGGDVTLQDLTLANGRGAGGNASQAGAGAGMGGAIFQNGGHLRLVNVALNSNVAQGGGWDGGTGAPGGGGFGGDAVVLQTQEAYGTGANGGDLGGAGGTYPRWVCGDRNGGDGGGGAAGSLYCGGQADGGAGGFGGGGGSSSGGGTYYGGRGGFGGGGAAGNNAFQSSNGGWGANKGTGLPSGTGAAAGFGGAIFARRGLLDLSNVSFTSNAAYGGRSNPNSMYTQYYGQGKGGALFVYDGALVNASNVSYSGNIAADAGVAGIGESPAPYTFGSTCPGSDTVNLCGTVVIGGSVGSGHVLNLTVQGSGSGSVSSGVVALNEINCPGMCSKFGNGSVTLTATAADGSMFTGWGGACSGTGTCTVSLASADQAVTATFIPGFTRIGNDGNPTSSTTLGTGPTDWACTRDNATGLVWEVKTTSGLRSQTTTYTNYDSSYGTTAQINAATNSMGFANAVNDTALCGSAQWRMPTVAELQGIVKAGATNPAIDTTYFPNTPSSYFWSGSPSIMSYAWNVNFGDGVAASGGVRDSGSVAVRLVRGGQSFATSALDVTVTGGGAGSVTTGNINCTRSGGSTSGTCSEGRGTNSVVTLTATPVTGSTFAGWGGACSGSASTCSITMDAAKAVSASFNLNTYTVTPSAVTGGTISPSGAQTVSHGGTTSFTVSPSPGYSIASVTGCSGNLSGNTYTTGAITGACIVNATFSANTSVTGSTAGGSVTAAITGGTCAGFVTGSTQFAAGSNAPAGQAFPYGTFGFTATGCGSGSGSVTITLTYPQALPAQPKFYKLISGNWVDWASRATFGANTVQYTVQDNQEGDSDPANGVITDPVALAAPAALTSIPTLSEWGLMLLAGMMLMLGMRQAQRRVERACS